MKSNSADPFKLTSLVRW